MRWINKEPRLFDQLLNFFLKNCIDVKGQQPQPVKTQFRKSQVGPKKTTNHRNCGDSFNHSRPFNIKEIAIISEPETQQKKDSEIVG